MTQLLRIPMYTHNTNFQLVFFLIFFFFDQSYVLFIFVWRVGLNFGT